MNARNLFTTTVHKPILDEHSHCLNLPEATRRDVKIQELIRPRPTSLLLAFTVPATVLLRGQSHFSSLLYSATNSLWPLSLPQSDQNGCSHFCSQFTVDIITTAARSLWLFSLLHSDHNGYSHCCIQITMAILTAAARSHWLFSLAVLTVDIMTTAARLQWLFSLLHLIRYGHSRQQQATRCEYSRCCNQST